MGNVHVFGQRFPALVVACFSSLSLAFIAIAGTTCSFLNVQANEGRFIESTNGSFQTTTTSTSFGVLCDTDLFDYQGDTMWTVSRIFLFLALGFGSLTTILAWILTWIVPPNDYNWKTLSVLSALTAVLTVPIYLMFESEPCTIDTSRQSCSLSFGCYILIIATIWSVGVTLMTQCIDPPHWGSELDAWKAEKHKDEPSRELVVSDGDEGGGGGGEAAAATAGTAAAAGGAAGLLWCFKKNSSRSLQQCETQATHASDENPEDRALVLAEAGSYYADSNNSRLLLKVSPEKQSDIKSNESFGDLDDYVKMAEAEQKGIGETQMSLGSLSEEEENLMLPSDNDGVLVILPKDGEAAAEPIEKFTHEPQYYTEMKPPVAARDNEALLENVNDSDYERDADVPKKISLGNGIRSLTSRIGSRRAPSYAIMDDDDDHSQGSDFCPPENPMPIPISPDISFDENDDCKKRALADKDHLHHQKLIYDWNALHAAASAGILLATEARTDSSSEDEPRAACLNTSSESDDDSIEESLGHLPDEEVDESRFSDSTLSDISDKEEEEEQPVVSPSIAALLVMPTPGQSRRRRQQGSRDYSSTHSGTASYTASLLDVTIDEETDVELKALETSSSEDEAPTGTDGEHDGGYNSAPESARNRKMGRPYPLVHSKSMKNAPRSKLTIIGPANSFDSDDSSPYKEDDEPKSRDMPEDEDDDLKPGAKTPELVEEEEAHHTTGTGLSTPETLTDDDGQYKVVGRRSARAVEDVILNDEEERYRYRPNPRRSRSMSVPRRKMLASRVAPSIDVPSRKSSFSSTEEPPDVRTIQWRKERLYRAGIHDDGIHMVSDSDDGTPDDMYNSETSSIKSCLSAKSCMSRHARKARIRRLQRERRQRSRTLDPPQNRRRYDDDDDDSLRGGGRRSRSSTRYNAPGESPNVTLNRLLFGNEHGPANDASSLV